MNMRHALITFATVVLLLAATGCDIMSKNIAVSGPKRYKSEVAAVLGDAKEQLDTDGKLKPATRSIFSHMRSASLWEGRRYSTM